MTTRRPNKAARRSDWTQVVIEDVHNLSGPSAADLFALLIPASSAQTVVADGVEGAKVGDFTGAGACLRLFPASVFLEKTREVVQFDWGDFYLFASEEYARQLEVGEPYATAVQKAVVTVRAVDDTYFYVYTKSLVVVGALDSAYPDAQVRRCVLEKLDFPR